MNLKQLFIGHFLTLLLGSAIYLLFRISSLRMFSWISIIDLNSALDLIRVHTIRYTNKIPDWIIYSLPDGLWMFSYVSLMLCIWKNEITKQSLLWILILPIIALCSELGQMLDKVPGTFDGVDITAYIIGALSPFVFFKQITIINTKTT
jgi:hypothetical protein